MNKKQVKSLVVALGLVAAIGVGGTLALLSQPSNTVTNTFAVGAGITKDDVTVDETDINSPDGPRTDTGNDYTELEPNMTLVKDPQVHVAAKAADSYVFVKVEGIDAFLSEVGDASIDNWLANGTWIKVDNTATKDGVYYYAGAAKAGIVAEAGQGSKVSVGDVAFDSEKVFTGITLGKDAQLYDAEGNSRTDLSPITVKSLIVQATGADSAWADALDTATGFDWTK